MQWEVGASKRHHRYKEREREELLRVVVVVTVVELTRHFRGLSPVLVFPLEFSFKGKGFFSFWTRLVVAIAVVSAVSRCLQGWYTSPVLTAREKLRTPRSTRPLNVVAIQSSRLRRRKKTQRISEGFERSHSDEGEVSLSEDPVADDCVMVETAEGESSVASSFTRPAPLYIAEKTD